MRSLREVLAFADRLEPGETAAVCTVVRVTGSAYGRPGARLILTPDGSRAGYVSGGCLEKELARRVWEATAEGPRTLAFDTRGNPRVPGGAYNAGCDGVIEILCERLDPPVDPDPGDPVGRDPGGLNAVRRSIETGEPIERTVDGFRETIEPPRPLTIFGAGDDARPLCELAGVMGWAVTVVAKQPELALPTRFPAADQVICADPAAVLDRLSLRPHSAAVGLTHDYAGDVRLLAGLLDSEIGYVGMLGPKRRAGRLMTDLHAAGSLPSPDRLAKLQAPVGLDIGAKTPEEIAAAVIAEIVAHFRGRGGGFLSQRNAPIHDAA
ncbi:XdhC family protein [Alienimonas chondri]|uniref:Xanthine dehydrogenase subunit A n=1 Tax=Alienimonas chondri TaxID=2681879 RepID=A0ABX1V7R9_9PLAN|nr:XdhC/CoxI family protein [Alienimonas chondri]NNJ24235.1 putative xanthine dehydrogenase subunit A [Alienimonas chondri]